MAQMHGPPERMTKEAEVFYAGALAELKRSKVPFLLAGTFAVNAYTNLDRPTKDLDIFVKASDYPKVLAHFKDRGYKTEVEDERWIAQVKKGKHSFDVIFNSTIAVTPVTDAWFKEAREGMVYRNKVLLLSPTELIWSKVFVQDRYKYDGADVAHVILAEGGKVDWKRLLSYMEQYWEVLLVHVLNFRFIYPTERERVPKWLLDELLERLSAQAKLPTSRMKVCRGRLFSRSDYLKDITKWGFADIIGKAGEK
jgi:hypothetical protein